MGEKKPEEVTYTIAGLLELPAMIRSKDDHDTVKWAMSRAER